MSKLLIYKNYQSIGSGYKEDLKDSKGYREMDDSMEYDNIDYTDCYINNDFTFFDDVMNVNLKIKEVPRYKNFELIDLKMSLEIARQNLAVDVSNKYYQKEFNQAKKLVDNFS